MPQIRSEWNTVADAKTARKRSLQPLVETFLHERKVRPEILPLDETETQITRPESINK